jgi:hypothetical protein
LIEGGLEDAVTGMTKEVVKSVGLVGSFDFFFAELGWVEWDLKRISGSARKSGGNSFCGGCGTCDGFMSWWRKNQMLLVCQ